jgi:ADP-ribosylglycohydrolase
MAAAQNRTIVSMLLPVRKFKRKAGTCNSKSVGPTAISLGNGGGEAAMLGAIAGDIIGSVYEWNNIKTEEFELFGTNSRFTYDTVMTIAIADAVLDIVSKGSGLENSRDMYAAKLKEYGRAYPNAGYGGMFIKWLVSETFEPYGSYGNGSAMRISPIGFAFDDLETVLREAGKSAEVTHNHVEGIKGAQAVAAAIFLARHNRSKSEIKEFIKERFGYDLDRKLDDIRRWYRFDVSCQGSVPEAIIAFLESHDYESAVRKAVSIGGDSDTIACITGGIAHAFYGEVPNHIAEKALYILDNRLSEVWNRFKSKYRL